MTTGKRALIVDDSRSARVILSRMLEQHGLTVDTAESAEQALEYLQRTRPDVIFMDHLMPGMDGFQAVQAIKADALTATIPLMMYTSQEGELYVSQARALGAVGVLPKTVRPADVSRVLYQLHLLPDRRLQRSTLFPGPAAAAAKAAEAGQQHEAAMAAALAASSGAAAESDTSTTGTRPALPPLGLPTTGETASVLQFTPALAQEMQAGVRQSVQLLVKDQLGEQRRFMLATFEAFARRLSGELRDGIAKIPPPVAPESLLPPPTPRQWWPVALTALLAVVPALVLGYLAWQGSLANDRLAEQVVAARAAADKAKADALAAAASVAATATVATTTPMALGVPAPTGGPTATEFVPYGEAPFAGTRLDRLRMLATALEAQQFRGHIRVESYVGDFCLSGTAAEGFEVAASDTPAAKCELVGNPYDDALSAAQRQSVAFANFAAMLQQHSGGAIDVEVVNVGRQRPIAYPEQDEKTTASEWNAVAARNNRVEFHVVPGA
jgi:CheY-like chemotaxis protein